MTSDQPASLVKVDTILRGTLEFGNHLPNPGIPRVEAATLPFTPLDIQCTPPIVQGSLGIRAGESHCISALNVILLN